MMFTFIIFAITYLLFFGYTMVAPTVIERKYGVHIDEEGKIISADMQDEYNMDIDECKSNVNKLMFITIASGILVIVSLFL